MNEDRPMRIPVIRHANRGSVKEGGCPMCKPVKKRFEYGLSPGEDVKEQMEEEE